MYMSENSPKGDELSILSVVNTVTDLKILERQRKIVIKRYYYKRDEMVKEIVPPIYDQPLIVCLDWKGGRGSRVEVEVAQN